MNGRQVRVKGIFESDYVERSNLYDRVCPELPIAPYGPETKFRDPSVDAFEELTANIFQSNVPDIEVDVTGKFVWRANETPHGALIFEKFSSVKRVTSP